MPEINDQTIKESVATNLKRPLSERKEERIEAAAGRTSMKHISASLVDTLCKRFSGEQIADKISELMDATSVNRAGEVSEDYKTQESAVKLLLAYTVGTPVQRQEQVNYNMDMADLKDGELIEKLASSPAMLSKVEAMVSEARTKQESGGFSIDV